MPINVPSYPGDPTSTAPLVNAYVAVIDFHLSSFHQTIDFVLGYFRTKSDYLARVRPANSVAYSITPNPEVRADGSPIPSYASVVMGARTTADDPAGTLAFGIVERSIYAFLMTLPEFAGASVVA